MDNFDIPTLGLWVGGIVLGLMAIGITMAILEIIGFPLSRIFRGLANHILIDFTWSMSPEEVINDVNGYVLTWDMVHEKRPSRFASMFLDNGFPKFRSATKVKLWGRNSRFQPDESESAWVQVWLPHQVRKWEYNLYFIRSDGSYLYFPIRSLPGKENRGVPLYGYQSPDDVTRWIEREKFPLTLEISRN